MGWLQDRGRDLKRKYHVNELTVFSDCNPEWGIITGHMIGPSRHHDVIDFVFVAKRGGRVA